MFKISNLIKSTLKINENSTGTAFPSFTLLNHFQEIFHLTLYNFLTCKAVFGIRIRIRPDPKLFGLKDPDPSFFHTKLRNMF